MLKKMLLALVVLGGLTTMHDPISAQVIDPLPPTYTLDCSSGGGPCHILRDLQPIGPGVTYADGETIALWLNGAETEIKCPVVEDPK